MLIDIHTHQSPPQGVKAIQNLYKDFETIQSGGFYSVGMHPWYIEVDYGVQSEKLKNAAALDAVLAIGETGLDKICNTNWQLQMHAFSTQIQLASALNKPLIIHCVKAWSEVMSILKQEQVTVPVVFHGFNKSEKIAHELIEAGFYLSFGQALKKDIIRKLLTAIPLHHIFLETDDAHIPIQEIYQLAADALAIDMNSLSLQLQINAAKVFGASFLV